jgi:hypothetical protein
MKLANKELAQIAGAVCASTAVYDSFYNKNNAIKQEHLQILNSIANKRACINDTLESYNNEKMLIENKINTLANRIKFSGNSNSSMIKDLQIRQNNNKLDLFENQGLSMLAQKAAESQHATLDKIDEYAQKAIYHNNIEAAQALFPLLSRADLNKSQESLNPQALSLVLKHLEKASKDFKELQKQYVNHQPHENAESTNHPEATVNI